MSLIIKDKIRMLLKGFPTVSDKYNLAGGLLGGSTPVVFGELVKYGSNQSGKGQMYEAITSTVTLAEIAGFVMGTNVKLNEVWPEGQVRVNPGEAFNLALPGTYMAIELDAPTVANIAAGKAVAVFLNTASKYGHLTTTGESGATDLSGVVFTGVYENIGTSASPVYLAEILIK